MRRQAFQATIKPRNPDVILAGADRTINQRALIGIARKGDEILQQDSACFPCDGAGFDTLFP